MSFEELTATSFGALLRVVLWLAFPIAGVELVLAFIERESSAARLRRALRAAPLLGFVAALGVGALYAPFRFAEAGYLVTALVVAVLAGLAAAQSSRAHLPLLVFALGYLLHAVGIVAALDTWASPHAHPMLDARLGALALLACMVAIAAHSAYAERSQQNRTQRNLLDSARKYRHVYYSAPVALLSVDLAGQIQRWNDLASLLFKGMLRQGRVNTLGALLGEERAGLLLMQTIGQGRHRCEVRVAFEEAERIVEVDALLAADTIEISFVDVTERTLLAQTLEHMAYHDSLTEQLNLHGLEREIRQVTERVAGGEVASLFYVDLHRFKAIVDVFGHAAGNALVAEVARRIEASLPPGAPVARLGGDEFLVVLPACPLDRARLVAQSTRSAIVAQAYEVDGKRIRVEASTGVVELAADMSAAELIAYASATCREAARGNDCGVVAAQSSGEHLARYRAEVELGLRLRTSLPVERIAVFAQPIVPLRRPGCEHASMSYEVLLRERDENGGFLPPGRLIAVAERHGAMRRIDWHMLERTLQHLDQHREHARTIDFVTVNLSGISLNDEHFLADAHALLRDCPAAAARVCLEITESVAMFDVRSTGRFVDRMRSLGVRIALDDFGAGYSSFAYLRELPASLVKIDGQFMPGIGAQLRNQVIVSGIRRLTEELGMACVAEWVEDVPALAFLLGVRMDYAQGFVLARPAPIEHWLRHSVDLAPLVEARASNPSAGRQAPAGVAGGAARSRSGAPARAAEHASTPETATSP
ncbi:MAG: EAL domain-containing protein [Burkholderiaceae bacterium]|nr:EAL domain-containing protein [Burkholderiaceae bacterium]